MSEDVSTVDYAQVTAGFVVSDLSLFGMRFAERPRAVGRYLLGNGDIGHNFYLRRKPGRAERFFVRHLHGLGGQRTLIGIAGPKRSGKTTLADGLCEVLSLEHHSFAGPIRTFAAIFGYAAEELEARKEDPVVWLGKTPR